jgi:hypothetical protein
MRTRNGGRLETGASDITESISIKDDTRTLQQEKESLKKQKE